jgi:antitoxin component YwqK of YwqJK toxin-antitoxin module
MLYRQPYKPDCFIRLGYFVKFIYIFVIVFLSNVTVARCESDIHVIQIRGDLAYLPNTDEPFSGTFTKTYPGLEQKSEEGTYKNGKLDGLLTKWYPNGQKSSEGKYKDAKKDGLWIQWHPNGQKSNEDNHKDGKLNGLWTMWYQNGQKSSEANVKDEKIEGLWASWYSDGKKKTEGAYKNGKPYGLWTTWDAFGNETKRQVGSE